MHEFDSATKALAESVLSQLRDLAALDPAPLNGTIQPSALAALARPMINPSGNDPDDVLDYFNSVLAPAVIRSDSPRFLAWIPAAPTKASMLFDAVVSLASISGVSWIESAGAVWAENEALRFIADLAGMPASRGRHVRAGRLGREPVRAGRRARHRAGAGSATRTAALQFAVTDDTHSSVRNTMHLLDVDPLLVPLVDDRLTGDALAATLAACDDPESVCAVVANAGSTNAGLVDDLAGIARICDERNALDARRRRVRRRRARSRRRRAPRSPASNAPTRSSSTRTSGCTRRSTAPRCSTAIRALARIGARPARGVPRLGERARPTGWNPGDYAYQLTRRARGLPFWFSLAVHGSDAYRAAVEHVLEITTARRGTASARSPTSSWCANPSSRSCCSGASVGTAREYTALVRPTDARPDRAGRPDDAGTTRPSPGSRSCTRTPRSRSSTRSSPPLRSPRPNVAMNCDGDRATDAAGRGAVEVVDPDASGRGVAHEVHCSSGWNRGRRGRQSSWRLDW